MEEIWKDIKGFEGKYQVSNLGNVKSLNYRGHGYEKNLTPKINNNGYAWYLLSKENKTYPMLLHRLVAEAFIENLNKLPEVNHKDENPLNNNADNLEWCTRKYNATYSMDRHPERYIQCKKVLRDENCNKIINKKFKPRKSKHYNKKINQFELTGKFVRSWENQRQIYNETGFFPDSIRKCCEGKRKTAHGYKWEYA